VIYWQACPFCDHPLFRWTVTPEDGIAIDSGSARRLDGGPVTDGEEIRCPGCGKTPAYLSLREVRSGDEADLLLTILER
jgi:hypothetical protein